LNCGCSKKHDRVGGATVPSPSFYDRLAAPRIPLLPERLGPGRVRDKVHKAARLSTMQRPNEVYQYLCSHWTIPQRS
jgi:hypothetical protein